MANAAIIRTQTDFPPHLPDQRRAWMTPHLFLSKSEMKSVGCDGPNGTPSPHGPALVRHGHRKTNCAPNGHHGL
jgi:hypothetical protein